jgi:hypothetical protein
LETAHCDLLRGLACQGAALAHYHTLVALLERELGVELAPATRAGEVIVCGRRYGRQSCECIRRGLCSSERSCGFVISADLLRFGGSFVQDVNLQLIVKRP